MKFRRTGLMSNVQDERKALETPTVDESGSKDEALPLGTMNNGMTAGFHLLKAVTPAAPCGSVSR
jgi:hypothetical protein